MLSTEKARDLLRDVQFPGEKWSCFTRGVVLILIAIEAYSDIISSDAIIYYTTNA